MKHWYQSSGVRSLAQTLVLCAEGKRAAGKSLVVLTAILDEIEALDSSWREHRVGVDGGSALCAWVYLESARLGSLDYGWKRARSLWPCVWKIAGLRVVDGELDWTGGRCIVGADIESYLIRHFANYAELSLKVGSREVAVTRGSCGSSAAFLRKKFRGEGVCVVRASSAEGLGLAGSAGLLALVKRRRVGSLVVPDATRLGRASWMGQMDLLRMAGLRVRLVKEGNGEAKGGACREREAEALDGCCVVPETFCGPVGVCVGGGMRLLNSLPRGVVADVKVRGGEDYPIAVAAALVGGALPCAVTKLVGRVDGKAFLAYRGNVIPFSLDSLRNLQARITN